jgi:hypothetical protein
VWAACAHKPLLGSSCHRLLLRYGGTAQYATASAALAGRQPFDLTEWAGRKRLINIHAGENEPLTTPAHRASYFRYFLANARAGTVAGLLPPPAVRAAGADGYEDFCRGCQHARVTPKEMPGASEQKRGELLKCDRTGCTAAYHPHCLGLSRVPAGRWLCPGCAYTPGVAAHPVARPGDPEPENLLAGLEDDE